MSEFRIQAAYGLTGDQPEAVTALGDGVVRGDRFQTLLGVTGSGKTFTMANVIQTVRKPTLVIAHNKTLAAQLCNEFREFLPDNAVEYFVSYYDYYQPEAYVAAQDLYIEKDSSINDEIDRLRHAATTSLFLRRDVVIVASVSCIYGLGSPEDYLEKMVLLQVGQTVERDEMLRKLVDIQYARNDFEPARGKFRVRGDSIEIWPASQDTAIRVQLWGDEVEQIVSFDPVGGEVIEKPEHVAVYPATHFVTNDPAIERSLVEIRREMDERCAWFEENGKILEAHRLRQRTQYDMEMLREMGYCSGIENYSRILLGKEPGATPNCLLDYFPDDFLCFVDESHMSLPQIRAMSEGDKSRKQQLVDYGFRLPSALDNRPLRFDEFEKKMRQAVFVSATPADYEQRHAGQVVEQVVRPTGLIDPVVEVRPATHQVDDVLQEIHERVKVGQRVLITTLTKRMAEQLTDYLADNGVKVRYLHSDIDTVERVEIIRDLRLGVFDVLVGINLLREGLDIPEVSLVAILDADKEGFLRAERSLIQTIGRAARHLDGKAILYADRVTESMQRAIGETDRRRAKQVTYNTAHGITPRSISKQIKEMIDGVVSDKTAKEDLKRAEAAAQIEALSEKDLGKRIKLLERQMLEHAKSLEFEKAARVRDQLALLREQAFGAGGAHDANVVPLPVARP